MVTSINESTKADNKFGTLLRGTNGNRYYLETSRLQRVIAAITVMGLHQEYKQDARHWVYRLTGVKANEQDPTFTQEWRNVFTQHNEFFRQSNTDPDHFSLILRRALEKEDGCAGFDTNDARWHLLEKRQDIAALQLTADDHIVFRVDAVHLKNRLCLYRDRLL